MDDSFITWRYGRNFLEHGVWNYNPTNFDPTQAYTNPIYALLSIVPAYLGINVVLFFKFFSILLTASFIIFFLRKRPSANLPLAIFFAIPATMVHIFSGLETFLFVVLVFFLLCAINSSNVKLAIFVTLGLFLTRPESWLLVVLVPLALSAGEGFKRIDLLRGLKHFLALAFPLAGYFILHIWLFGQALPNTFYVKSGQYFVGANLLLWILTLLPLVVSWRLGFKRVSVFAALFFGAIAFHYSTAFLTMDYAFRYAFHIIAPLVLFVIYLASEEGVIQGSFQRWQLSGSMALLASLTLVFGTVTGELPHLATNYPKLLATHGEIGSVVRGLSKSNGIKAIAVGDAGLIAYNADVPNLDLLRLGTHIGATQGISKKLIEKYGVDLAVLRGFPVAEATLRDILRARGLKPICLVDFSDEYKLNIWARENSSEFEEVCNSSKVFATESEMAFLVKNIQIAPWAYWR